MWKFLEIARTGLTSLLLHPLRSLVTSVAVLAVLLPFLTGLGIAYGIQAEAEASIHYGADLYVSGVQFGHRVPVPLEAQKELERINGVTEVIPRIVGRLVLGGENAVLVGLPRESFPATVQCVEGRLPEPSTLNELVVGSDLARRLHLKVGTILRPFYHNAQGDRLSKVVGLFRSDDSLWQANLIFTSLETASAIFDQRGLVTDFLVYCRPDYQVPVSTKIYQTVTFGKPEGDNRARPKVTAREHLLALLPRGLLHREGIFLLHFTLAFAVGILVVLVISGFGLSERRREIGILKAIGWQTDEILLRGLVESFLLTLASASLAIILSFVWLKWLNGYWIASIFLIGVDVAPGFQVPFCLTPVPAVLSFIISFVVVMTGTLYSSWRAATVTPAVAMR